MKRDERLTLRKGEIKSLPGTCDNLEYLGIEDELLSFNFYKPRSSCKVLIPLDRINNDQDPVNIIKYQFFISKLTEEEVTLKYLRPVSKMFE